MIQPRLARSLQRIAKQAIPVAQVSQGASFRSAFARINQNFASCPSQSVTIRCYSQTLRRAQQAEAETEADKEKVLEEQAEAQGQQEKPKDEAQTEDPVQKELETKKREVIDLTDRLKRSVADYRNLQNQTKREVQAARDFALQKFTRDLLDSIDNLDRALTTVPADKLTDDNKELVDLHSGLKMTERILMQTLNKHGLERFDPSEKGEKFDPNKHEAVFQAAMKDKEDGAVFHTQQKGFMYNGRILRAAKVGVTKNS